jgi:hypothetical protein
MNNTNAPIIIEAENKKCPACAELIKKEANKCKHCGEIINQI